MFDLKTINLPPFQPQHSHCPAGERESFLSFLFFFFPSMKNHLVGGLGRLSGHRSQGARSVGGPVSDSDHFVHNDTCSISVQEEGRSTVVGLRSGLA